MTQSLNVFPLKSRQKKLQQINLQDYEPLKIGLHYSPPMIMIEYIVPSSGKLLHHKIRLEQHLRKRKPIEKILRFCRSWHNDYLLKYEDNVIINLIRILQDNFYLNYSNNIENNEIQNYKEIEEKNEQQLPQRIIQSAIVDHTLQTSLNNQQQQVINERSPTPQFNSYSEPQQPKELDYQKFDLNKLTTDELNKEKSKMDEVFLKNQKKPGESGFVYDIQKDFEPYEENEWDDEDEEW